jgi:integrase
MYTKAIAPEPEMGPQRATSIVPYLTPREVRRMAGAVSDSKNGERDKLLIMLSFETGLRISETLSLTSRLIGQHEDKPVIYLKKGKWKKPRRLLARRIWLTG